MAHPPLGRVLFLFAAFLSLSSVFPGDVALSQEAEDDKGLLRSVLVQNEAALNKVLSAPLYVAFSWEMDATDPTIPLPTPGVIPGGKRKIQADSRLWREGNRYHQDINLVHTWEDGRISNGSFIIVLNDTYLARYRKETHLLEVYHFENRNSLYAPASAIAETYPDPDILELGFKGGTATPSELFWSHKAFSPPPTSWRVSREVVAERPAIVVQVHTIIEEPSRLEFEYTIDPGSGYLISGFRWLDSSGKLEWKTDTTFQELNNGVWFPKKATVFRKERKVSAEYTVDDVRVGEPIPETRFAVEGMEFDPETTIMREYSHGGRVKTERGFFGGEWVPLQMMPAEHVARLKQIGRDGMEKSVENNRPR